jgi:hypothetical protein
MLAYVLITVNQGSLHSIVDQIKLIGESIRELYYLYGQYDILIKMKSLSESGFDKNFKLLKNIPGVKFIDYLIVSDRTREEDILVKY